MTAISFSLFRGNIDPEADLLVRVGIAGTAVLDVDYAISGFDNYANTPPLPIGWATILAGADTCQIVCTPTFGLVQSDRTVTLIIEPDATSFRISPTQAQATGILRFPSTEPLPPLLPIVDFSVSPTTISETAAASAVFTANRRAGSSTTDSIVIAYTIGGSATIDIDYSLDNSTRLLTIPAGQNSGSVTATAIPNSVVSADRQIRLLPTIDPETFLLGDVNWLCTIVEDTPPPPTPQLRILAQTQLIFNYAEA